MNNEQDEIQVIESQKTGDEIHDKLAALIDSLAPNNSPFTIILYKWNKNTGKQEQMEKWVEETPPDTHEIGLMHGSGRYQFVIQYEDMNNKSRRGRKQLDFTLGASYDEKRKEYLDLKTKIPASNSGDMFVMMKFMMEQQEKNQLAMQERSQNNMNSLVALATAIVPLLLQNKSAPQESTMDKLMIAMIPKMMEGSQNQANHLLETSTKMLSKGIEMGKTNNSSEEAGWMDVILKAVENADSILGLPTALVQMKTKKDPTLQQIANNPEQQQFFLSKMEEKHGSAKTKQIIEKAGYSDKINSGGESAPQNGVVLL